MATLSAIFAMEDKVSSVLGKIERYAAAASQRFEGAAQSTDLWQGRVDSANATLENMVLRLAAAEEAQGKLDAAAQSSNPEEYFEAATSSALMTKDAYAKLAAQYENLSLKQEQNELNLHKAIIAQENAEQKAASLNEQYRAASETASAYADAQARVSEMAAYAADEQDGRLTPATNKYEMAMQRNQAQLEITEQRIEAYQQKMNDLTRKMLENEAVLERLNELQAGSYSSARQQEIDNIIAQQDRLNQQYGQSVIQIQAAENQHRMAFGRMAQATQQMNPLINGINMGLRGLSGNARLFGSVAQQAMAAAATGARAATVAFVAMNAAATIGISLLIQGGISLFQNLTQSADETAGSVERLDRSTRDYGRTVTALTGNIRSLTPEMLNMGDTAYSALESYLKTKESTEDNITQMQVYAFQMERNVAEIERLTKRSSLLAEEQERLEYLMARTEGMMPGIINLMRTESGELAFQRDRVWELVDAYVALAYARAQASAAETLMGEALRSQIKMQNRIRKKEEALAGMEQTVQNNISVMLSATEEERARINMASWLDRAGFSNTANDILKTSGIEKVSLIEGMRTHRELGEEVLAEKAFGDDAEFYHDVYNDMMTNQLGLEKIFRDSGIDPSKLGSFDQNAFDKALGLYEDGKGNLKTANQNEIRFSEEDLRMLHDITRREYYVRYQQVVPQVIFNIEEVREEADLDRLSEKVAHAIIETNESRLDVGVSP